MTQLSSCILAIDAGGTSLKAALIPEQPADFGESGLLDRTFFTLAVNSDGTSEEILNSFRTLGMWGADLAQREKFTIKRVAVCVPGPFDYSRGASLMKHKYQAIYGIPLGPQIMEGAGHAYPITFMHDSIAFLLGAVRSAAAGKKHLCGVTLGTGLGYAAMIDGKIQEHPTGGPVLRLYAEPYLDGIAEDYVSKRGILKRYEALTGLRDPQLSVADLARLTGNDDAAARKVFAETGTHLGRILLPVLKEYHFSDVLLGGAISKSAHLFLEELNEVIADTGASALPVSHIDLAPLIGAALY